MKEKILSRQVVSAAAGTKWISPLDGGGYFQQEVIAWEVITYQSYSGESEYTSSFPITIEGKIDDEVGALFHPCGLVAEPCGGTYQSIPEYLADVAEREERYEQRRARNHTGA